MVRLGYLFLVAGFLAAAYVASLDPTAVDWAIFVPTIIVGAVGVLMIRRARRMAAKNSDKLKGDAETLRISLEKLNANLEAFRTGSTSIPTHELRFEIDKLFRDDLRAFADARQTIAELHGLQAYGDVMSAFAAGERYLNRIWSASTDGYEDEARAYIEKAHAQFIEAKATFDRVTNSHATMAAG